MEAKRRLTRAQVQALIDEMVAEGLLRDSGHVRWSSRTGAFMPVYVTTPKGDEHLKEALKPA
jgi:hypothetical protein